MDKIAQLRQAHQRVIERADIVFGELAPSRDEVLETVRDMDTFREETRQNRGEALTLDEA